MLISLLNFIFTTQKLSLLIFYFLFFRVGGEWLCLYNYGGDAILSVVTSLTDAHNPTPSEPGSYCSGLAPLPGQ